MGYSFHIENLSGLAMRDMVILLIK
jgi:hypothetical protein